jgi:hypothetical protein
VQILPVVFDRRLYEQNCHNPGLYPLRHNCHWQFPAEGLPALFDLALLRREPARLPLVGTSKGRTTMNWIPITEKLPKEHEFVLFCCYIEDEELADQAQELDMGY